MRGSNVWELNGGLPVLRPLTHMKGERPRLKRVKEAGEVCKGSQGLNPRTYQLYGLYKLPWHSRRKCNFQVRFPIFIHQLHLDIDSELIGSIWYV